MASPAFRWYDRELGRVLIANRPDDAAIIEQRATTGAGLLADDGLALGNLFTGDAPRAVLTMSRLGGGRRSAVARGDVRLVPHQSQRLHPRGGSDDRRGGEGALASCPTSPPQRPAASSPGMDLRRSRAATNVLQRDLNTAVVAEEMRKGTKSIYVDYVDYDEIAHHAGMFRPESLAALDGLDRVLGTLERLSTAAARRYHIVVSLTTAVPGPDVPRPLRRRPRRGMHQLMKWPPRRFGRRLGSSGLPRRRSGWRRDYRQSARRAAAASSRHVDQGAEAANCGAVSVLGSGNLGLLYVHSPSGSPWRISRNAGRPRARPVCTRGHRFRCRLDSAGVPWVLGEEARPARHRRGDRTRPSRTVRRPFSPDAPARCRDAGGPDLYINSRVSTSHSISRHSNHSSVPTEAWAAGRIVRVLLAPRALADVLPAEHIEGADRLHAVLVAMLRAVGQRKTVPE